MKAAQDIDVSESMRGLEITSRQFFPAVMWRSTYLWSRKTDIPALLSVSLVKAAIREALEFNVQR